ncbi:alpha/beta hydrolase [Ancylomarina longa]|uniref:Serine aminopeptidase S33 domain-containing protein n=1 Tax=Ancylomarina longa TaxID=2487017 RepID=A0A434AWB0_9BACT|nr:alpha/beta fold hydrolase [Ancylomarina longa]RUT78772.1 hypothetical protein DLK05_06445 [Ancylomarina longa]
MKYYSLFLIAFFFLLEACNAPVKSSPDKNVAREIQQEYPQTIQFTSLDSVMISANLYQIDEKSPFILLCHQARFNKFEYAGIAERLNEMGFNCLAIDQRSGGPIGNTQNQTHLNALKKGKAVSYLDAEQDIQAAIQYIGKTYNQKVILWGSSYSSTLALYLAAKNDAVKAVISFSPGNYFADEKGSLVDILSEFKKPMFVTSSRQEADGVKTLLEKHKMLENQTQFIPNGPGQHGSRNLWKNQTGGEEYWNAITVFLKQFKQ